MVTARPPIIASVVAAFLDFGFLKAGTPLEMASTPVSAADPEENPRATRKTRAKPDSECSATNVKLALSACITEPVAALISPYTIITRMETMKA